MCNFLKLNIISSTTYHTKFEITITLMPLLGGLGELKAHPECRVSVNPIPIWGADYVHRITAWQPRFENLTGTLY